MRLTTYETRFDAETGKAVLVKESSRNCPSVSSIRSPSDAAAALEFLYGASTLAEEHVWVICLSHGGKVIGALEVSHGTDGTSFFSPREILMKACLAGASSIIVAHNHTSGDVSPSGIDRDSTKRLKSAADILGITLLDHIIIGSGGKHFSFREEGALDKKEEQK